MHHTLGTLEDLHNIIALTGHKKPLMVIANELQESILVDQYRLIKDFEKTHTAFFIYGYTYDGAPEGYFQFSMKMENLKRFTVTFWIYLGVLPVDTHAAIATIADVYVFRYYLDIHCNLQ